MAAWHQGGNARIRLPEIRKTIPDAHGNRTADRVVGGKIIEIAVPIAKRPPVSVRIDRLTRKGLLVFVDRIGPHQMNIGREQLHYQGDSGRLCRQGDQRIIVQ